MPHMDLAPTVDAPRHRPPGVRRVLPEIGDSDRREQGELVVPGERDQVVDVLLGASQTEQDDAELERLPMGRVANQPAGVFPERLGTEISLSEQFRDQGVGVGDDRLVQGQPVEGNPRAVVIGPDQPSDRVKRVADELRLLVLAGRPHVVGEDAVPRTAGEPRLVARHGLLVRQLQGLGTVPIADEPEDRRTRSPGRADLHFRPLLPERHRRNSSARGQLPGPFPSSGMQHPTIVDLADTPTGVGVRSAYYLDTDENLRPQGPGVSRGRERGKESLRSSRSLIVTICLS
jgi:hypothetical protein